MDRKEKYNSPEERTAAFLAMSEQAVAEQLPGMVVELHANGTDQVRKVRITEVDSFSRKQNESNYRDMYDMQPGDWYVKKHRAGLLSLMVTRDFATGEIGACVQVKKVEFFDVDQDMFVSKLEQEGVEFDGMKQRDIARFFGMEDGQIGGVRFVDLESNVLALSPKEFV